METLATLHAIDLDASGAVSFGRGDGYVDRQLRRFGGLLTHNATRPLPNLVRIGRWLEAERTASPTATLVHGDFRLGNVLFEEPGLRIATVLDWELATIGDPLSDIRHLGQAHRPTGPDARPLPVTRSAGFPGRDWLAANYAELSGRSTEGLTWYCVLALWKAAIFLEGSYTATATLRAAPAIRTSPVSATVSRRWHATYSR